MNEGMENLQQIEELEEDNRRMNKIVDKLEQRIKGMKNKNVSREDKILARVEYEKQQSMNN